MSFSQESAKFCRHHNARHLCYQMHISLRHGYVYVETPKTACTAIKLTLQRLELDDPGYNPRLVWPRKRSPLLNPKQVGPFEAFMARADIYKFCWARNPYARFLSAYFDKVHRPGEFCDWMIEQMHERHGKKMPPNTPLSLEDFVFFVENEEPRKMDHHWRPQHLLTQIDLIRYDFIGRFEHFERDMRQVARRIGFEYDRYISTRKHHATEYAKPPDDYWTGPLRKRVARIYEADFEHFGYPL